MSMSDMARLENGRFATRKRCSRHVVLAFPESRRSESISGPLAEVKGHTVTLFMAIVDVRMYDQTARRSARLIPPLGVPGMPLIVNRQNLGNQCLIQTAAKSPSRFILFSHSFFRSLAIRQRGRETLFTFQALRWLDLQCAKIDAEVHSRIHGIFRRVESDRHALVSECLLS